MTAPDDTRFPGLRDLVGTVGAPLVKHVTSDAVRRFTESLAAAMPAPPSDADKVPRTFFCPDPLVVAAESGLSRPILLDRTIDGGSEWEFVHPVRLGDELTLIARIADITQRSTRDERVMISTVLEVRAWNQLGELVGIARGTSLNYEARADDGS